MNFIMAVVGQVSCFRYGKGTCTILSLHCIVLEADKLMNPPCCERKQSDLSTNYLLDLETTHHNYQELYIFDVACIKYSSKCL